MTHPAVPPLSARAAWMKRALPRPAFGNGIIEPDRNDHIEEALGARPRQPLVGALAVLGEDQPVVVVTILLPDHVVREWNERKGEIAGEFRKGGVIEEAVAQRKNADGSSFVSLPLKDACTSPPAPIVHGIVQSPIVS